MEHLVAVDGTRFLVTVIAVAIFIAVGAERVFDVTAGTEIAPSQAKREVERPPGLAGHNVFRIKQAGPADIFCPHGHLRHPVALFPQTQLEVEGFIFVSLVARERLDAAVLFRSHIGVAQRGFKPREKLYGGGIVAVLVVIAVVQTDFPFTRHARGGRLQ